MTEVTEDSLISEEKHNWVKAHKYLMELPPGDIKSQGVMELIKARDYLIFAENVSEKAKERSHKSIEHILNIVRRSLANIFNQETNNDK